MSIDLDIDLDVECVSPLPGEGAAGLDVPGVVLDGAEAEVLGDLRCTHAALHVLLVGQDQNRSLTQVLHTHTHKDTHRLVTCFSALCIIIIIIIYGVYGRRRGYLVGQHAVQLFFRDDQPLSVRAVHHQDNELQTQNHQDDQLQNYRQNHQDVTRGRDHHQKLPEPGLVTRPCSE